MFNPQHTQSKSEQRPSRVAVLPLSVRERHIIFREMVKAELEAGLLRYSKRRQLLHYAARMGLQRVEALLIIAQLQHGLEWSAGQQFKSPVKPTHHHGVTLKKLTIAAAAAVALHWLTLSGLLG